MDLSAAIIIFIFGVAIGYFLRGRIKVTWEKPDKNPHEESKERKINLS